MLGMAKSTKKECTVSSTIIKDLHEFKFKFKKLYFSLRRDLRHAEYITMQ